jgi:hypothetical protein
MNPSLSQSDDLQKRMLLLREATELLMWELSAITGRKWEDLPELKRKKESLAERLREFDWTPGPRDEENTDLVMLKSQISDLEFQSRQRIQVQLQMIRMQMNALQDQQQYWLECLNVYFGKTQKP